MHNFQISLSLSPLLIFHSEQVGPKLKAREVISKSVEPLSSLVEILWIEKLENHGM